MNQTHTTLLPCPLIIIGTEKASSIPDFNSVVLDSLNTLLSSLGCKKQVFHLLKEKYKINYYTVSKNVQAFTKALEEIFGEASPILEIKMMHLIHDKVPKFSYYPGEETLSFNSYLKNLQYGFARNFF